MEIIQLTKVEEEVKNILEQVRLEWVNKELIGDKNWTNRIKKLLHLKGEELGYEVCASGIDCNHGEWLYDIVWYENNEDGLLKSVPLVVESEWKRRYGDIKYDFEKLLLSNSDQRVMICQGQNVEELKSYFFNAIKSYNTLRKGDRFLIAILEDFYSGEFFYEVIIKE